MPRPSRCRRVCCEPLVRLFAPQGGEDLTPVVLLVEEYEAIRIVDLEKRTHDQCAQQMQISRTTATEIYEKARFKIADAIVNGKPLVIEGGNYRICQETNCCACAGRCRRKTVAQSAAQDEIRRFRRHGHGRFRKRRCRHLHSPAMAGCQTGHAIALGLRHENRRTRSIA